MKYSARRWLALPAIAALLGVLALACGKADTAKQDGQVTLRIGDQGRATEVPLRLSGVLDNLPYKVEFNQFNSGPLVNQAVQAGAIDLGFMGDTPAMFAQASNIPVTVVGVSRTDGPGTTLLAKPGSGINGVGDLRGKKIATSKNTALHGFLLRVLDKQGLTQNDIQLVDVPLQNLGNILESGTVDAATVQEEARVKYVNQHPSAVNVTNTAAVAESYGFRLAARKALADPATRNALKDFVGRLVKANDWIKAHPDQYIDAYYVKERKQDLATGRIVWEATGKTTFIPIDDKIKKAQQDQADLFLKNGLFPKAIDISPQFDPAVTTEFNAAVKAAS